MALTFDDVTILLPSETESCIVQLAPQPMVTAIVPARERTILVDGLDGERHKLTIQCPRLAWSLLLGDQGGIELRALSPDDSELGPFLLGNAYDNGDVCWGASGEPASLRQAHSQFWSAPFNADLWQEWRDHEREGCTESSGGHECERRELGDSCDVNHDCQDSHSHECGRARDDERCEVAPGDHEYRRTAFTLAHARADSSGPPFPARLAPNALMSVHRSMAYQIRSGKVHMNRRQVLAAWAQGLAPFGHDGFDGCWCAHCASTCRCSTGCECCDGECGCLNCLCEDGECECCTGCECCEGECECSHRECSCGLADRWLEHVTSYAPSFTGRAFRWLHGSRYTVGQGARAVLLSTRPEACEAYPKGVRELGESRILVAFAGSDKVFRVAGRAVTLPPKPVKVAPVAAEHVATYRATDPQPTDRPQWNYARARIGDIVIANMDINYTLIGYGDACRVTGFYGTTECDSIEVARLSDGATATGGTVAFCRATTRPAILNTSR